MRGQTLQSFNDPNAVASIVGALRHAHGDAGARLMLIEGLTLADLIESLLRSPIKNREAIRLAIRVLGSDDFLTEPQIAGPSHIPISTIRQGRFTWSTSLSTPPAAQFRAPTSAYSCGPRRRRALKSPPAERRACRERLREILSELIPQRVRRLAADQIDEQPADLIVALSPVEDASETDQHLRLAAGLGLGRNGWAANQPDLPDRSEAIRRLVEIALKAKGK